MQLRADIQLRAAIKALTDTVAPAIDASNKLAVEQLGMVIGILQFVEQRLPLQFQFDCNELARLIGLAAALDGAVEGSQGENATQELRKVASAGALVLDRAKADPAEVLEAVRGLRHACGAVTTAAFGLEDLAVREAVSAKVLAYSKEQTLRDRSWLIGLGFESPNSGIPAIAELLATDAAENAKVGGCA